MAHRIRADAELRTLFLLLPILVTGGASGPGNHQRLSASITCTIEQGSPRGIGAEAEPKLLHYNPFGEPVRLGYNRLIRLRRNLECWRFVWHALERRNTRFTGWW